MDTFETDSLEIRGQVTNCPKCMGKCELAGGIAECENCEFCGTNVVEQE